jgi:DNA (cytosine-5)-methyltransferase 1
MIPIVDIFAGPGGLGEGFASVLGRGGKPAFDIVLSIEKDRRALETLRLRTFFRRFPPGQAPDAYYRFVRGEIPLADLYALHPWEAAAAASRTWHAELGGKDTPPAEVHLTIENALRGATDWVLVGGPPCQAYSIAGRVRNQGQAGYDPEKDGRQRLYVEYLDILGNHWPAAFIMENVKGILSANLKEERVFTRIVEDVQDPAAALGREGRTVRRGRVHGYRVFSLTENRTIGNGSLRGAVIQAERYGIPQARHRVILLGLRDDLRVLTPQVLRPRSRSMGAFSHAD